MVTAYHGLVLWSANPTHAFLEQVLHLVYHNGHTADAANTISGGVMVLTTSIELLSNRKRLTTDAKQLLKIRLTQSVDRVLSGLEIGARLAGPSFPDSVRQSSVRALAALVTISPQSVDDVLSVLSRCVQGRYDETGAEILSVVIDILGGRVGNLEPVIGMVSEILEQIAMGGEVDDNFAGILMALVEVVVRRCVTNPGMERVLNGLMGLTGRWAGSKPGWMIGALDCWMSTLDTFEDCNMHGVLVDRVYTALAKVCVERCMQNPVLAELEEEEELLVEHDWDEIGDVADVATDPVALSSCLFIRAGMGDPDGFDSICTRDEYVGKCVETLLAVARLSPTVANETTKFTITKLGDRQNPGDMVTAAQIAFGLSQISQTLQLLERVYELLTAGLWREAKLGAALFRTAAAHINLLRDAPPEMIKNIGGGLLALSRQALVENGHLHTVYAGAVLSLTLDSTFRKQLFESPPLPCGVILSTPYPAIATLGVSSTLQWALFPPRGKDGRPEKWDETEWARRTEVCREMLQPVFAPSGGLPGMSRYASLVDVVMDVTYGAHPQTVHAVWRAVSEQVCRVLHATVQELCGTLLRGEERDIGDVLARVVRALNSVKRVHGREKVRLDEVVRVVMPFAGVSEMLTEACLGAVRGMLDEESLREEAVHLARSTVSAGGGVGELAVGVLYHAAENAFSAVLAIVEGVSSKDIGICRESLQALQKLNVSQRLFGRPEFARVREGLVKECVGVIGIVAGRECLAEEAVEVLWGLHEGGDGVVEKAFAEIRAVVQGGSRNEFGRSVLAAVHDYLVRTARVSL